ncbi:MAG: hypothetical protein AVO35_00085 [Candidatus Aegiribacteria sp. MLS_C]|nr:MAG: hypothetical protein AVO35_00085 [Candidatus Aegiribacteria sp. MLS_C]
MRIAVLGGGLVGGAIARDLAAGDEFGVRVCDISSGTLERLTGTRGIETLRVDLSTDEGMDRALEDCGMAVGAVPGSMGFDTVRRVLERGLDIVDISFFPEDSLELDDLAVSAGARCLVDFGIAPGCSNLVCGRCAESFGAVSSFSCMVGGLPAERRLPWEYQAPFSPSDVLEEYTRPARIVRGGRVVTLPPLTETELVDFPEVGTLEAFLTDGLRSLLRVEGIPEMVEKTLRYPGYVDRIELLKRTGFLDGEPIDLSSGSVSPLELTSELLFRAWKQASGDRDLTVMRIRVEGTGTDGNGIRRTWDLLDRYDAETGTSSMARTTGYTCTAGVRLLAGGRWTGPGVHPPEDVGRDRECFDFVMEHLYRRGVRFRTAEESTG